MKQTGANGKGVSFGELQSKAEGHTINDESDLCNVFCLRDLGEYISSRVQRLPKE